MTVETLVADRPVLRRTVIRVGRVSAIAHVRRLFVGVILVVAVGVIGFALLYIGTLPAPVVTKALFGGGSRLARSAIVDGQLPVVLTAVFAGAGLAAAGAAMQTVARNPLATPDFLGVTAGASTTVVLAIGFASSWGGWFTDRGLPVAAFVGATCAAAAMYAIAWRGALDIARLVLAGVAVTWLLHALSAYLLTRAQVWDAQRAQRWIVGSLTGTSWDTVAPLLVLVPIGIVASMMLSRRLAAVGLGDDMARSLGVSPSTTTFLTMTVAVVLAAAAVSGAGPIAFVGLLAPQIAARVTGTASAPGPVTSALVGALLVLCAELACRVVLPSSIPVGIVTAGVGGPFLVWLLLVARRKGRL